MIFALTSIPPGAEPDEQARLVRSWMAAGCEVISFNDPAELERSRRVPGVEYVEIAGVSVLGRFFAPITAMLTWARTAGVTALLINADIELRAVPAELERWQRLGQVAQGGLVYVRRFNYRQSPELGGREPYGVDGFLLDGLAADLCEPSWLCMGKPMWDYWLPFVFARAGRPVSAVEYPIAYHRHHERRWSPGDYQSAVVEFARVAGLGLDGPGGLDQRCASLSRGVHEYFEARKLVIPPRPDRAELLEMQLRVRGIL